MRKIILETTVVGDGFPCSVSASTTPIEFSGHTSIDAQRKLDNFMERLISTERIGDAMIYRTIVEVE